MSGSNSEIVISEKSILLNYLKLHKRGVLNIYLVYYFEYSTALAIFGFVGFLSILFSSNSFSNLASPDS